MHAVVTAVGFLALLALGVAYLVDAQRPSSVAGAVPGVAPSAGTSRVPSSAPAPTSGSLPGGSDGGPSGSPTGPDARRLARAAPTLVVRSPGAEASGSLPGRLAASSVPRLRPEEELASVDLTLASFNVLGASHTTPGGSRPGYATGTVRARWAADLLERRGVDVVGFQELQPSQLRTLRASTDLDFYPGHALGRLGTDNSIGWRRGTWQAVERRTIDVPYFDGGPRAMPVVRLRHLRTGIEAWFTNFHNPADTARFHHQQRFRTRATLVEARLASLLAATGLPVFVTGDMNERAAYFCRLTSRSPMVAARGGSNVGGRCRPGAPTQIDWIFGSQGVQFSGYAEDDSPFVDRTSDHPLLTTRARIQAAGTPAGG